MKIHEDFAMTINGQMVTTENTLPVYNPATRSVFAQVLMHPEHSLMRLLAQHVRLLICGVRPQLMSAKQP